MRMKTETITGLILGLLVVGMLTMTLQSEIEVLRLEKCCQILIGKPFKRDQLSDVPPSREGVPEQTFLFPWRGCIRGDHTENHSHRYYHRRLRLLLPSPIPQSHHECYAEGLCEAEGYFRTTGQENAG